MSCSSNDFSKLLEKKMKELKNNPNAAKYNDQLSGIFKSMNLPSNKVNGMLANLQSMMQCGTECQKRKKADQLKKKWDNAKKIKQDAPGNVEDAEKNYYLFTEGDVGYKEHLVEKYKVVANKKKDESLKKHNELMNELNVLIKDYEAEKAAGDKINALFRIRLNESDELKDAVDSDTADVNTNDRKVIYEEKETTWLNTVKKILHFLYVFVVLIYVIWGPFLNSDGYKTIKGWTSILFFIAWPFSLHYIVLLFKYLTNNFLWYFNKTTKNVYS